MDNIVYLITGNCGVGKTFVAKQLINALNLNRTGKNGLYHYVYNDEVCLFGKYEGNMFDGSDRLAMNIMADNQKILDAIVLFKYYIAEGDRFTNSTFIRDFKPVILRVLGDGASGRLNRGSVQSDRHLRSIATRVANIQSDYEFANSNECFEWLLKTILEPDKNHFAVQSKRKPAQNTLF